MTEKARSSFFEKKEAKKLLSIWPRLRTPPGAKSKKFFGSFFQKRTFLLFLVPGIAQAADGAQIFTENCAMCHQADGAGAAGLAPPLAGALKPYATTPAGAQYLSQILISGMAGKISTRNGIFKGLMPSFADKLSDAEIVAVLTYALANFNDVKTPVITTDSVAGARKAAPSATDTRHAREAALGKS